MKRKLPLLFAVLLILTGCVTATGRHYATVTVVTSHSTLAAIQDTEMLLVCGRDGAPSEGQCVTVDLHRDISARLSKAFEYDKAVATLVRDVPVGQPQPQEVGSLLVNISRIVQAIVRDLPKSPRADALRANLGGGQ